MVGSKLDRIHRVASNRAIGVMMAMTPCQNHIVPVCNTPSSGTYCIRNQPAYSPVTILVRNHGRRATPR